MTEIKKIAVDTVPHGFDPDRNPIIAEHFFGWRRLGDVAAENSSAATREPLDIVLEREQQERERVASLLAEITT